MIFNAQSTMSVIAGQIVSRTGSQLVVLDLTTCFELVLNFFEIVIGSEAEVTLGLEVKLNSRN